MTSPYAAEHTVQPNAYATSAPHASALYQPAGTPTAAAAAAHHHSQHRSAPTPQSMDSSRPGDYQQGSHPTPKQPQLLAKPPAEQRAVAAAAADQSAQYTPQHPDTKFVQSVATPTNSDYSSLNPSSARSGTFSDYSVPRSYPDGSQRYQTAPNGMAQPTNPSIAQSSPTYPPQHYSPYPPHHDMSGHYSQPPPMYRPDYGAHYGGAHFPIGHPANSGGHPMSTVYSFVPIPGTHQQKRPRRRYEEIERMYKCGWNGCEKAYGTLNHLNAHVTMQGHGSKRTPEEFKEIRKEWKARKKEEETARKQEEDRQRQQAQQQPQPGADGQHNGADAHAQQHHPPTSGYSQGVRPQLPPLGYAPASGQVAPQYGQTQAGMEGMAQYPSGQIQGYGSGYPPHSPYGQANQI